MVGDMFDKDLDALAPQSKKVKLNGKVIDVSPPKFKNLLAIMRVSEKLEKGAELDSKEMMSAMEDMYKALLPIVPALAEEGFDLTFEQLTDLLEFVMSMVSDQTGQPVVDSDKKKLNSQE